MGLFSKFKKTKKICLEENLANVFFHEVEFKKGEPKIGMPVEVPENHLFAFATKRRILDILPAGSHELTTAILPKSTKQFSLMEKDKKGNVKAQIPARCFYLKKGEFKETWKTLSLQYKSEKDGIFSVEFYGELDFSIIDERKFFTSIFEDFSCRNEKHARKYFRNIILNLINDFLERKNFSTDMCMEKCEIETFLLKKMQKPLEKIGIAINSISIINVIFDKKTTEKLSCPDAIAESETDDAKSSQEQTASMQSENSDDEICQNVTNDEAIEASAEVNINSESTSSDSHSNPSENLIEVLDEIPVDKSPKIDIAEPLKSSAKPPSEVQLFGGDRVLLKNTKPKQFVDLDDED